MRYLIGVDDTDNLESRGTGHRVRQMGRELEDARLANVLGITRHQLLVDPAIPYTSHNSSACVAVETDPAKLEALTEFCRDYLLREGAPGSDVGLCIVEAAAITEVVQGWGQQAKYQVLTQQGAKDLAVIENIWLQGLTGTGGGIIGALAAVGLRAWGNDGRVLWLPGLRELEGVYTAAELFQSVPIDQIESIDGQVIAPEAHIDVGDWPRPIVRNGRITLLVETTHEPDNNHWRIAAKDYIKHISD